MEPKHPARTSWTCAIQGKRAGHPQCRSQCSSCVRWFPPQGCGSAREVLAWIARAEAAERVAYKARMAKTPEAN